MEKLIQINGQWYDAEKITFESYKKLVQDATIEMFEIVTGQKIEITKRTQDEPIANFSEKTKKRKNK
jgi:hypothetical protein